MSISLKWLESAAKRVATITATKKPNKILEIEVNVHNQKNNVLAKLKTLIKVAIGEATIISLPTII